jgi:iron complex outermembrane receptor protein
MMKETVISRAVRVMCAGGLAVGMQTAFAQSAPEAPIQRVEITGSSLKRVDSETALPVQTISKADIAKIGATSTQELLGTISALSSSGSYNNSTGAGNSTYGLSSISLRGLGGERTLVLVNGRRLAAFAGGGGATVNVNVIPLAAIERVEVLKDGASGVYGSDAVAGVVNFILSKSFQGIELQAGGGVPTHSGGGQNQKYAVTAGFGDLDTDRYSIVLSASAERERALFASERGFAASGNKPPYYTSGATGQGNIEGAVVPGTNPLQTVGMFNPTSPLYGNPLAAAGNCSQIQMIAGAGKTALGAPVCSFDSAAFVGLTPKRELNNFTANGTFKINDQHELFADVLYSESTVVQSFQGSPVRASFLETDAEFGKQGVTPALLLYPGNPAYQNIAVPYLQSMGFNSLIGQPLSITSRVFDFGNRVSEDKARQSRVVLGAKGVVAGQDYEVALTHNQSKVAGTVPGGYFSQVAYARIINDPSNNWNPWAAGGVQTGALAEKLKAAQYSGSTLNGKSTSTSFDGKITGDLPAVAGITAQYAAGLQSRIEKLQTNPSPALEAGDIAGLGGSVPPVDRERKINSAFAETNVPLAKNLDVGAAVRYDHYDDVGPSTNYKANVRWQPVKQVLLRASAGSGFRAPTLTDLWQPQSLASSETFNDPKTNQTQIQVNALSGGNPDLKPEESRQKSVGLVLAPFNNFTVGFDWFKIKVSNMLSTPSAQEVVSRFRAGDAAYANMVALTSTGEIASIKTLLTNSGDAVVKGFDVFANYRQNTAYGRFDVNLNGTYMDQFDQTSPGGDISHKVGTLVDAAGNPVLGAQNGGVVLRWKHTLSTSWSKDKWSATVIQNYSSRYETGHRFVDDERNFVGAQATYDLNVSYKPLKPLTLTAGVRNLFDKQPSTFVPVSNQFQSGYDINQYDPRGRFLYVNASYRFM